MRTSITIVAFLLVLSSCLKHDVLKEETDTHIRQSEFYTSGQFDDLQIIIENISFERSFVNGVEKCRPLFTIRLQEQYAAALGEIWDDPIQVSVFEDGLNPPREVFTTTNYHQSFQVQERSSVDCGSKLYFNVRLELPNPRNGQIVVATTKQFSVETL